MEGADSNAAGVILVALAGVLWIEMLKVLSSEIGQRERQDGFLWWINEGAEINERQRAKCPIDWTFPLNNKLHLPFRAKALSEAHNHCRSLKRPRIIHNLIIAHKQASVALESLPIFRLEYRPSQARELTFPFACSSALSLVL